MACRAAGQASRVTGRGDGAVIGGRLLLRWFPDVARGLAAGRRVVVVSGTNGKTTTTSMLAAALRGAGPVATNATGANTAPGIVSALASSGAHTVVLECDEAWLPWCIEATDPELVVLLNLSRDQLDRHHEVAGLARRWRAALTGVATVVANAADPNVVFAAEAAQRQVWVAGNGGWRADATVCPRCGDLLVQTGDRWSSGCGLSRPAASWSVRDGLLHRPAGASIPLRLALPGRVNQDNAASAVAAAAETGYDPVDAARTVRTVDGIGGRYGVFQVGQHRVRLVLAKNPAGWTEALRMSADTGAGVALAINAREADGRDPSWLWDVDVSSLRDRAVVTCGERFLDIAVRLETEGIPVRVATAEVTGALDRLPGGDVDLIANYTAFSAARRELARAR